MKEKQEGRSAQHRSRRGDSYQGTAERAAETGEPQIPPLRFAPVGMTKKKKRLRTAHLKVRPFKAAAHFYLRVWASAWASCKASFETSRSRRPISNFGLVEPRPQRVTSQWARTNFAPGVEERSSSIG